ncbi:MAG: inner-rane translocator [Thermomicrobiales bacterium]|jgi:ribose transport system permease protein|nr:inner-rane translocator [Thermomicrobiales bacterium]MDF3042462.1 inner-rane translocator [Thermomicrobiales bacterium]
MVQEMPQGVGAPLGDHVAPRTGRQVALNWASRNARLLAPLVTLISMFVFFSLVTDVFLTTQNLQNIVTQIAPIAVAATGVTFVLLCAEIDLSIASVATFTGVLAAWFWVGDTIALGTWGIPVAILVAAAIGLLNGYMVAFVGIPSFMMTLAMLTIARGMSVFVSEGKPIFEVPPVLKQLGSVSSQVFGIPVIGLFAVAILLLGEFVLSYTKFGRYVYMTGANREAAEMSGVNTRQVVMMSLVIASVTAGLTGLLFVGRLSSANPSSGEEILISTIAAVVLGGTSLFGGEGGMRNTILGLLIFGILSNGLNLLPNIPITFKQALQGIVLLAALLLNVFALRIERVQTRNE